jgi:hypothetical protein
VGATPASSADAAVASLNRAGAVRRARSLEHGEPRSTAMQTHRSVEQQRAEPSTRAPSPTAQSRQPAPATRSARPRRPRARRIAGGCSREEPSPRNAPLCRHPPTALQLASAGANSTDSNTADSEGSVIRCPVQLRGGHRSDRCDADCSNAKSNLTSRTDTTTHRRLHASLLLSPHLGLSGTNAHRSAWSSPRLRPPPPRLRR